MKIIEVDEDLYRYIAGQTKHIGESASDILRRLLNVNRDVPKLVVDTTSDTTQQRERDFAAENARKSIVVSSDAMYDVKNTDSIEAINALIISSEFTVLKKAIDRFMTVLSTLYRIDPVGFSDAMLVKGRKRVYFASDKQTLLESGQTTKPKAIPNTPFWVITNNNTSRKRQMIEQVMVRMGFSSNVVEDVTKAI